jgi:hypothetical protein
LVADVTPPEMRGAAYGLRQSMDTTGHFSGHLTGREFDAAVDNDFRTIFWIALIPGLLSVAALFWSA